MFIFKTKARKNGPLKALQSVQGDDLNNNDVKAAKRSGHKSAHSQHRHAHRSKDDISTAHSQQKEKVKTNPYATIKMWRPVSMATSSIGDEEANVYQTFSNFDALRINSAATGTEGSKFGDLPATGDIRNQQAPIIARSNPSTKHGQSGGGVTPSRPLTDSPFTSGSMARPDSTKVNGGWEVPADYPRGDSPAAPHRKVSFQDTVVSGKHGSSGSAKPSRPPPPRIPDSPPPPPLPSSPPPSQPNKPSQLSSSLLPSTPTSLSSSSQNDTSFCVVSDGATNSIRLVLSHKYSPSGIELASNDVDRLLSELKLTMDSLRTSRIDKNSAQLTICLSELRKQAHKFIQDAKLVVSSANNSRDKMVVQLETAVHTLALLFLHCQACMLMMESAHRAQHLGLQVIKAANSFQSTVGAANAAVGKALNDPHMKYLMRQATNLASLLASLLNAIKDIQAEL